MPIASLRAAVGALITCPVAACARPETNTTDDVATAAADVAWEVDFFDEFDRFEAEHWQTQLLSVNDEQQFCLRDKQHDTRLMSDGTLILRVVDLGAPAPCNSVDQRGKPHPPTQYVAARISSKNRRDFVKGRWTARPRVEGSGQAGMFPAWWLPGARNDEAPVESADEEVCWPLTD